MIFLCPGFLLGLIFVYGCSLWGGPAVMGGGLSSTLFCMLAGVNIGVLCERMQMLPS